MGWAFWWCTKQAIVYQWQGHWRTAASPSERVTQCHSDPGGSSDSYPSTKLSSNKAPGSDSIPVEIYEGGSALTGKLLTLVQLIWVKEQLSQDFKDASILHIYKWKGNQQACDNHHRISLFLILSKILARVLLNHLNNHLEHGLLLESQCSFCKEHGTVDIVFAAREVSGTEHWPLLDLCWSDQGIWHDQQRQPLENHGKIRLPQKIHHHH